MPFAYRSPHIVYLGGLAIHPSFAGKGYGFTMMQEIIAYAKQQGLYQDRIKGSYELMVLSGCMRKLGFKKKGY